MSRIDNESDATPTTHVNPNAERDAIEAWARRAVRTAVRVLTEPRFDEVNETGGES